MIRQARLEYSNVVNVTQPFLEEDTLTSHMYEILSKDEINHSIQSYMNIQSSTTINPEASSFQYDIFDQNVRHVAVAFLSKDI